MANKVKWIVVSGLDGSGKTTLVDSLDEWLRSKGFRVMKSRLPHDKHLVQDLLNESTSKYTDRMIFALDNRIFAEKFRMWQESGEYDIILTQRGFLDSFVHGAVQGFSYAWIAKFNQIAELPKCDCIVHMVAEPEVAYKRIQDDPDADKFENPPYIRTQAEETRRAYVELMNGNIDLAHFKDAKNIYVDTTQMSCEETFELVKKRLEKSDILK